MAAESSPLLPPPQFGRLERASVSLSSADHSPSPLPHPAAPSHASPPSPYSHPAGGGSSMVGARETLLQVQRESTSERNGVTLRKLQPVGDQRDKTLRQKGIILTDDTTTRHLHPLPPPPLIPPSTQYSLEDPSPTALKPRPTQNGEIDGVLNVFSVMQLSASLTEGVGSPDSGYDDLAMVALACNRSDSVGSASSSSSRRTGPNSGVPSSLFSTRDSELELVKEEEGDDNEEDNKERKERGTSNTSSEHSDAPTASSSSFPPVSLEESSNFYTPDDDTVIQTVHRRGIRRTHSTEESVGKRIYSTGMRPNGRAESYSSNMYRAVGSKSGAERGRSQSLYTKGQLHVVSVCVCVFVSS